MPPRAESFGRKNDPAAAREPQCVTTRLLAGAHESGNTRAARPEARSPRNRLTPLGPLFGPLARTAERLQDRQLQKRRVPIAIPLTPEKADLVYALEILAMALAKPAARRILTNIARKCRELILAFDDPVMPVGEENSAQNA